MGTGIKRTGAAWCPCVGQAAIMSRYRIQGGMQGLARAWTGLVHMRRLNGPHLGRAERSQLRERLYSIEVIFSTAHLVYSILYSVNSAVER